MCILILVSSPRRGFPISRRCSSSVLFVIAPESVSNGFPLPGEYRKYIGYALLTNVTIALKPMGNSACDTSLK